MSASASVSAWLFGAPPTVCPPQSCRRPAGSPGRTPTPPYVAIERVLSRRYVPLPEKTQDECCI